MGGIGIEHRTFMRELCLWQIRAIIRGYRRRQEDSWTMTRWHAFWALHNGFNDLQKAGINTPQDMLPLPHDSESRGNEGEDVPTEEEIEQMQQEMRRWNEEHAAER